MDIVRGLNAAPEKVFKTLVMSNKQKGCYFVFMILANRKMDAKKAKVVTGEKLSFVNAEELAIETRFEKKEE